MERIDDIERELSELERKLAELDAGRARLIEALRDLRKERAALTNDTSRSRNARSNRGQEASLFEAHEPQGGNAGYTAIHQSSSKDERPQVAVTKDSPALEKIALFRSLFRGRDEIYARRFESRKTGKSGYAPACRNEWVRGVCRKPEIPCQACQHRALLPITDRVIRNHMMGRDPQETSDRDFTVGIYPMLRDETCRFLAVDFDKASWCEDSSAYLSTCRSYDVPAVLERSRSGDGGHVWIFFAEPIPAFLVRQMGSYLLTRTMERRPEIGLDSYDRFFPSQDTLPDGGFGNLIALPLQNKPAREGNSLFVDDQLEPYPDQWLFLSSVARMDEQDVRSVVEEANDDVLAIREPIEDEASQRPWETPPSRDAAVPDVSGLLPERVEVVLGNQIYVSKEDLTASLYNRLVRLAAFQNPEFYKAQSMRLSTYGKPRIISCCEDFSDHIGLPRGCLDDLRDLFDELNVDITIDDQRYAGVPTEMTFQAELRPDQSKAADALLQHDIGILSAATAFGKSVVAANVIARRGVNTLVVVHRRQLLEQWVATLSRFLNVPPEHIGIIGAGKHAPTGKVDVAMLQSLVRKGIVDDVVGEYGHVVVDECHHISAVSFERVVREAKGRYLTGLSATIVRKDGHHPIIFMQCGPVRYRVDDRKQAKRRPFDHHVLVRTTNFELPPPSTSGAKPHIQAVFSILAEDRERNRMIVRDVLGAVESGRSPVVLTERRKHVDTLVGMLSAHVPHVFALTGGMRKTQREALMEKIASMPRDEPRVLVSTGRYLGEGFDDERLDTLFLTLPVSWRGTVTQYAGRLHRVHDDKNDVIIYDYVDENVPVLAKMHERRRAGYKALGYDIMEQPPSSRQLSFKRF